MSALTDAQAIYDEARAWYHGSRRSDNKRYDLDEVPEDKRAAKAERNASVETLADVRRLQGTELARQYGELSAEAVAGVPMLVSWGQILLGMDKPVLNCAEISAVAYAMAHRKPVSAGIFVCRGFDHEFCVIGSAADLATLDRRALPVERLGELGELDVAVVDVWLATCCAIASYGDRVTAKLDSWTAKGKRVATCDDMGEIAWVVPGATGADGYKTRFLAAIIDRHAQDS
ncbi:hypothetical protein IP88_16670 [alpha proteobacterium AAP81b]|nr:hypothetical protein IP88_16670 [alpha proteobacterium AAP81b]